MEFISLILLNFSMMEFGLEIILRMVKTLKYFGFTRLKFRDVILKSG